MDIKKYYAIEEENPLDTMKPDGGLTAIFRTIGCIGDSLSSGEFESTNDDGEKGYHDMYEYSWGQHIARTTGAKVYNFSRGGMTADAFHRSFAETCGCYSEENACQAYIIAMGFNEVMFGQSMSYLGKIEDIDLENPENNKGTLAGWYGRIIQQCQKISPKARFFLMTMPKETSDPANCAELKEAYAALLHQMAGLFPFTYVIDFHKYAPVYDEKFKDTFYLGGHMNASGYWLTAQMTMTYIDYIIRNHPEDFTQTGFIGKGGVHNIHAKW